MKGLFHIKLTKDQDVSKKDKEILIEEQNSFKDQFICKLFIIDN